MGKYSLGEKCGKWLLVADDPEDERRVLCKCDCGKERSVAKHSIRYDRSKSCGCLKKEVTPHIDEIGNKYGRLTVISKAESKPNGAAFNCLCECGEETIVLGGHLRAGTTTSCGCYRQELLDAAENDLTGQTFGRLKVLFRHSRKEKGPQPKWVCQCSCGNRHEVNRRELVSGKTNSCGCIKSSVGEALIEDFLKNYPLEYTREFVFDDLVGIGGGYLRYDFLVKGINNNFLIEFDGPQHFDKNNRYYSDTLIKHDLMKENYAKDNKINLYRIRFDDNLELKLNKILEKEGVGFDSN